MNKTILVGFAALLLAAGAARSATITWTNADSGSFGTAANWSPNSVPGSSDVAVITNTGTYTVTLDIGRTLGRLQMGAVSGIGTQTFDMNANALTFSGGSIVNTNGLFKISNNFITSGANLTNNGTVTWTGGTVTAGQGEIYNNGLWDAQGNNNLNWDGLNNVNAFNNAGTFRKSAGSGTTLVNGGLLFNNTGTLDVQSGTVNLIGGGANTAPGVFNTTNVATLTFGASYTFHSGSQFTGMGTNLLAAGTFTMSGNITFSKLTQVGGTLAGTHDLNGLFVFSGGNWVSSGATTITNGSILNIAADLSLSTRTLTNNGPVVWTGGTVTAGQGVIYNNGLWDAQGNNNLNWDGANTPKAFNNAGTFRKSAGSGTTLVNGGLPFNNTGTLDVQSGTVSLFGGHSLSGGTVNIGISSLSSFGKLNLSGASAFAGNFSANLNGGYIPITNNSFAVITYGSLRGTFTNVTLPFADAWSTNYGGNVFTLLVLNARPIPSVLTNQIVNELVTLTVTNTSIDLDVPTNILTYTLLAPPAGAVINSSGAITWTPSEDQGPATNVITTVVTDNGVPGLSVTNFFTVVVNEINVPPGLPLQTNVSVLELTTLVLTNTATDSDLPVNALTYTLLEAPGGAAMDTNGVITCPRPRWKAPARIPSR